MAVRAVSNKKYNTVFEALNLNDQEIFLSSFIAHIYNELNAGIEKTSVRFWDAVEQKIKENKESEEDKIITASMRDYIDNPCTFENRWNAPQSLQPFANPGFLAETNHIMSQLPPSKIGFWSEIFKAVNNEILIAVRLNGPGYDVRPDVIIQNMNPHKLIHLNKQDLEKIALWLQQRGFPQKASPPQPADYHKAYGCIMGSTVYQQRPANLYFAGRLELNSDIEAHYVDIDGTPHSFGIVVGPLPEQQEPLSFPAQPKVIPETYSKEILDVMFDNVITNQLPSLVVDTSEKTENDPPKDFLNHFSQMRLQSSMLLPDSRKSTCTSATFSVSPSSSESSSFFDSSFEDDEDMSWNDCSSEANEDRVMTSSDEENDEFLADILKLSQPRRDFFK
ncbi:MAG TPA: hypothetical protein PLD88_07320, partial [Candidatus Berkiella sp.]|nr:hypothetical protein [Candidatus Berkiella sp.]